jgi:hypothetical protein
VGGLPTSRRSAASLILGAQRASAPGVAGRIISDETDCACPGDADAPGPSAFRSRIAWQLPCWLCRCGLAVAQYHVAALVRMNHAPVVAHWCACSDLLRWVELATSLCWLLAGARVRFRQPRNRPGWRQTTRPCTTTSTATSFPTMAAHIWHRAPSKAVAAPLGSTARSSLVPASITSKSPSDNQLASN